VGYTIQDWIECCFELIGRDWRQYVKFKEGYVAEFKRLVSNPQTMNKLGWKPKTDIHELARMMVLGN
jgi:GDPmannose 4,6-dehydratase